MEAKAFRRHGWACCFRSLLFLAIIRNSHIISEQQPHRLLVSKTEHFTAELTFVVQTSFHCLRLSNFLIRPSLESLQALLILGFVLANDMKAEASWALIGLTCRLAQALGLHRAPSESGRTAPPMDDLPRRKLWY